MLCSDMFVGKPFSLFRGMVQHAFSFIAERHVHGRGNFFTFNRSGFYGSVDVLGLCRQKTTRQAPVFTQQAQQQVFSLYSLAAELAGFIPSEKDYTSRLFCISFKHGSSSCTSADHCTNFGGYIAGNQDPSSSLLFSVSCASIGEIPFLCGLTH